MISTSCQVKQTAASGGLISGHVPVTNKFTIDTPTTKTYVAAEVISLTLSFPFDIIMDTLGGSPRLAITVGGTAYYANYVSQPTAKQMTFTYTVIAGDNDTDGIVVNALELNGSLLTFNNNGVITNCDVTTITTTNLPGVKVDTTAPTISNFTLNNVPGYYNEGEVINFSMVFSEAVYVTGAPKFVMNLTTGGAVDVTYASGSGTTTLAFTFTVGTTHADVDGYDSITSPIDITSSSIKDTVGNNANLDFSAYIAAVITASANVLINGQTPYVVAITPPTNGTYQASQNLDFIFEFDRAVNVTGSPYVGLTIGSTARQAVYTSGSGT